MNILIVGDVYSKLGRKVFEECVKEIKSKAKINFLIVNGENTSHGKGLNEGHYKWYLEQGVNVITMGNHTYQNGQIFNFIDDANNIVRPANFADNAKGKGYVTVNYNGLKITVMQVIGQVFMNGITISPFTKAQEILDNTDSDIYICDFHGEATSEKIAFGYAFDGKIQVIVGTHTHVQTTDERILPNGSAYITDLGMTGALNGVIGVKSDIILNRYLKNETNSFFTPEDEGPAQFGALLVSIDEASKKVTKIERIHIIK